MIGRCLDSDIDAFLLGYEEDSPQNIAEYHSRKYGISPCNVLEMIESKSEAIRLLRVLAKSLTKTQGAILLMIGAGYTLNQMSEELGLYHSTVIKHRNSISERLFRIADEGRIERLKEQIGKAKGKAKIARLSAELEERMAVREAMKKLLVLLTPPESMKEIGDVPLPLFTFERLMKVGTGQRRAKVQGHWVYQNTTKCVLPEYFHECFGDKNTCCMLCATCRRKNDITGRNEDAP